MLNAIIFDDTYRLYVGYSIHGKYTSVATTLASFINNRVYGTHQSNPVDGPRIRKINS